MFFHLLEFLSHVVFRASLRAAAAQGQLLHLPLAAAQVAGPGPAAAWDALAAKLHAAEKKLAELGVSSGES